MDYLTLSIFIIIISIIIILLILYNFYFTKESFYNIEDYKCSDVNSDDYCLKIKESNPVVCFIKKLFCVISNLVNTNDKLINDNKTLESEYVDLKNDNNELLNDYNELQTDNKVLETDNKELELKNKEFENISKDYYLDSLKYNSDNDLDYYNRNCYITNCASYKNDIVDYYNSVMRSNGDVDTGYDIDIKKMDHSDFSHGCNVTYKFTKRPKHQPEIDSEDTGEITRNFEYKSIILPNKQCNKPRFTSMTHNGPIMNTDSGVNMDVPYKNNYNYNTCSAFNKIYSDGKCVQPPLPGNKDPLFPIPIEPIEPIDPIEIHQGMCLVKNKVYNKESNMCEKCPDGYITTDGILCDEDETKPEKPTPEICLQQNKVYNKELNMCKKCPDSYITTDGNFCVCPDGYIRTDNGLCKKLESGPAKPTPEICLQQQKFYNNESNMCEKCPDGHITIDGILCKQAYVGGPAKPKPVKPTPEICLQQNKVLTKNNECSSCDDDQYYTKDGKVCILTDEAKKLLEESYIEIIGKDLTKEERDAALKQLIKDSEFTM